MASTIVGYDPLGSRTMHDGGPGQLVRCLKCTYCGWSVSHGLVETEEEKSEGIREKIAEEFRGGLDSVVGGKSLGYFGNEGWDD